MIVCDLDGEVVEGDHARPATPRRTPTSTGTCPRSAASCTRTPPTPSPGPPAASRCRACSPRWPTSSAARSRSGRSRSSAATTIGRGIVDDAAAGTAAPAVLMANHGPFTIGRDRARRGQGRGDVRGRRAAPCTSPASSASRSRSPRPTSTASTTATRTSTASATQRTAPRAAGASMTAFDGSRSGSSPAARACTARRRWSRSPSSRGRSPRRSAASRRCRCGVVWKPVLTDARRDPARLPRRQRRRRRASASSPGCTRSPRPRCGSPGSTRCASRCCTCTRRPNAALPWATIDMDFMNLNQAAHGDREFGLRRRPGMRLERKTVVGHVSDPEVRRAGRRVGAGGRRLAGRRAR